MVNVDVLVTNPAINREAESDRVILRDKSKYLSEVSGETKPLLPVSHGYPWVFPSHWRHTGFPTYSESLHVFSETCTHMKNNNFSPIYENLLPKYLNTSVNFNQANKN